MILFRAGLGCRWRDRLGGQSYEESVWLDYHFDISLLKRNIMIAIVSHSRNPEGLPFVGNMAGHGHSPC